ncbi:MAG: hypothetical protein E7Z91_05745 [Cyanobacteria bacterium SIG30]|nr:hypothetical protein [Cyanobacteria bacterium SIG30]
MKNIITNEDISSCIDNEIDYKKLNMLKIEIKNNVKMMQKLRKFKRISSIIQNNMTRYRNNLELNLSEKILKKSNFLLRSKSHFLLNK